MTREPLTREALIAAVGSLIIQGLVVWGVPLTDAQTRWLQAVATLAALAYVVLKTRPQVTPVADPRDQDGRPLLPVPDTTEPT